MDVIFDTYSTLAQGILPASKSSCFMPITFLFFFSQPVQSKLLFKPLYFPSLTTVTTFFLAFLALTSFTKSIKSTAVKIIFLDYIIIVIWASPHCKNDRLLILICQALHLQISRVTYSTWPPKESFEVNPQNSLIKLAPDQIHQKNLHLVSMQCFRDKNKHTCNATGFVSMWRPWSSQVSLGLWFHNERFTPSMGAAGTQHLRKSDKEYSCDATAMKYSSLRSSQQENVTFLMYYTQSKTGFIVT